MRVVLYLGLNLFQGLRRKGDIAMVIMFCGLCVTKILFLICQSWNLSKTCTEQQFFSSPLSVCVCVCVIAVKSDLQ